MNIFRLWAADGVVIVVCLGLLKFSDGQPQASCQRPLDVSFVVYCGPEISASDWTSTTSLISGVSAGLSLSTYGSHVSLIYFSRSAVIVSELSDQLTFGYRPSESGRNMSGGIWKSTDQLFTNSAGDRPEVPDKMIVITMVVSDNTTASETEAAAAKSLGIHVVTVGIGTDPAMIEELKSVATNPNEAEQLRISTPDQYATLIQPIINVICSPTAEASSWDIRLVDGNSTSGRVEMYWNMEWVTISNVNWTTQNTLVVCKQLGYLDGMAFYAGNSSVYVRRIGLTSVQCTGSEASLAQCQHDEFFVNGSQHSHLEDVFLRCLCSNCNDYVEHANVLRLADGTSMSGRLEMFFVANGYMSLCANCGWSDANTRVSCRELNFADGAGTYEHPKNASFPPIFTQCFSCSGTETALSTCRTSPLPPDGCNTPVCVRCMCRNCIEILVKLPAQQQLFIGSIVRFQWIFNQDVSTKDLKIFFMSSKNPQLLLQRTGGETSVANTDFKSRIRLVGESISAVTFEIAGIWRTDIGWYALHIKLSTVEIYNQQAALFITDFAILPPSNISRQVGESLEISWDLRVLEQLGQVDVQYNITTPPSGRLMPDYYYDIWLPDNKGYTYQPLHPLMPSVYVKTVQESDHGQYVLDVRVKCVSLPWLNAVYSFKTSLTVEGYVDTVTTVSDGSSDCSCSCSYVDTVTTVSDGSSDDCSCSCTDHPSVAQNDCQPKLNISRRPEMDVPPTRCRRMSTCSDNLTNIHKQQNIKQLDETAYEHILLMICLFAVDKELIVLTTE